MKKLLQVLILLMVVQGVYAQDPQFSQFYAAPIYLNPALAGSSRCPRVTLNYRNQWPSLNNAFVTYAAAYDQQVDAISGGLGLIVMSDKAGEGTINTTSAGFMYAYQAALSRKASIRAAIKATYVQKKVDWDKLTFGDMIDPRYGFVYQTVEQRPASETRSFMDFSAGIVAYSDLVYGGVAVDHLTQPDEAFLVTGSSELPMKITAHFGAMIPIGYYNARMDKDEGTFISPNIIYQQQRSFNQLNLGAYFSKSPFVGGLWYRGSLGKGSFISSDSFIALVGIQKGMFKVGYSYDITVSQLSNASGGAHEVSLGLQFPCHPKKKRFRPISCPTF
ncbi:MAG: type IX secretion system membrane protein PorP/SprF [Bacteroidia bacterium]